MSIYKQHIMRVAAVLALTAASTSAFAQSADYRRGYEDGYAAAREERGPGPGQDRGGLRIEEANYGVRGMTCNARRSVRDQVERNNGRVVANDQLCGDSAPGKVKRLQVTYRCDDSEAMRVVARQGDTLRLSCRR
ncbi:hypothetical protein [Massilia litorea]|uniref:Secreted protein n=1 Tax=Massilia litorea TaxID=2769491 RepID=A0A7L9U7Z6_9BURK|nr:hypothetical protein [Massilia litorea]QOL50295.1 hypothetical protein LPB04_03000 [Massilia litorea]